MAKKFFFESWRSYLAEFLGTFIFVFVSLGAVLTNNLLGEIGVLGIALASGFAYIAMIFATVHLSGGQLNPAITLSLWLVKKLNTQDAFFYILAQFIASFAAAGVLFYVFGKASLDFSLGAQILGDTISLQKAVVVEAILTSVLIFTYFATMTDRRGPVSFGPFAVGLVVFVSFLVAGPISGGSINPARVLGAAVISKSYSELSIWLVGPFTGSLFGLVYDFLFLKKK